AVALFKFTAAGQWLIAVEHTDVVHAQEAAAEDVPAAGVLAVDPEAEAQHFVLEHFLQEGDIARSRLLLLDLVDPPRGPTEQRRIYVVEVPFIGWELPAGVLVPFVAHLPQLLLGARRVDVGHRDTVKGQVP